MSISDEAREAFQASLKAHREAAGWTYADMGRAMGGVKPQRAHELETSDHDPKLGTVASIAAIFGESVPEFLSFKMPLDRSSGGH